MNDMNDEKKPWMFEESWFVEVTGMQMDFLSLKLEVGENPKVRIQLAIKRLLEEMTKEDIIKLKEYCDKRLSCLG